MTDTSALDRPVPLPELLDRPALDDLLASSAAFHRQGLAVVDERGLIVGQAPPIRPLPPEVLALRPTPDGSSSVVEAAGGRWDVASIVVGGIGIGTLVVGPIDGATEAIEDAARVRAHVVGILTAVLSAQLARHQTARLHVLALEEQRAELGEKNRQLAAAVERMHEVDRLKSNFLATVSHELRTPLTSVIGYSEMLLEGLAGALNDEQREYVQTIMEKGDQLLQLITGILDVSRIEAGTLRVAQEPVDLSDVIAVAVAAMGPMARRKRLTVQVGSVRMPRALGDRDKLRQVLLNLLGNAIKFTPEGGRVEVQLSVGAIIRDEDLGLFVPGAPAAPPPALDPASAALASSQPIGTQLGIRMVIVDNGIGIAPEKQARIFEPFFQVDSSSTREYGGTGLGLTLVKSYIEAHGGKVWVDSALGRGSVFTITLPAVEDDLFEYLRQNAARAAGSGEGEGVRRASQSDRTAP